MKNSHCLTTSIAIMKYSGVWMPDNLKFPLNLFYTFYAVVMQTCVFYLIVLAEIGYLFMVMGNTERTVDAAVLFVSHMVQGVKVLTIIFRQGRIKRLIKFIDGPKFVKSDPAKQAILDRTVNLAARIGQALIGSAAVTAIFWCIVPTLQSEIVLPLKTAYPFDISQRTVFAALYAYNSVSVTVVGVEDAAANYLVSGLIVLAGAQLDVLREELTEIGADDKSVYEKTVKCIKYHQDIIEYVEELASIFGLPILCQFITSSITVCMTLFMIMITSEPIALITIIFYLTCVFLELLMYCYPGDLLINKSLLVADAAYPNNWSGDHRSRRALLLTTMRAQRALVVNAGSLFRVSLPTAAAVVQTAYSYYAVLRQKANVEK